MLEIATLKTPRATSISKAFGTSGLDILIVRYYHFVFLDNDRKTMFVQITGQSLEQGGLKVCNIALDKAARAGMLSCVCAYKEGQRGEPERKQWHWYALDILFYV